MFAVMPYLILAREIPVDTRILAQVNQGSLRSFSAPDMQWNRDDKARTWLGCESINDVDDPGSQPWYVQI
jgi:hypothetical protein